MTPRTIHKTLLRSDPGQAWMQLEDLASKLAPQDNAAGAQLRAVAVELVRLGLQVTVVDYQDASCELEVILPHAADLGPVTIDRDVSGAGCQLTWEHWTGIADRAAAGRAADMTAALLNGVARAGIS